MAKKAAWGIQAGMFPPRGAAGKGPMKMDRGEMDIFDRLMTLPVLRLFQPFFAAHREGLLYLFFGGLAFLLSVATYALFQEGLSLNELVANLLSWIICVAFAFVTNQTWVFRGEGTRTTSLIQRLLAFYAGRIATLLVEEAILAVFAIALALPGIPVKVAAQVVVILLNYVISKMFIFKERE